MCVQTKNINECNLSNICGDNSICTDSDGSFECACIDGYANAESGCQDIDECISSPCDVNASCTNGRGDLNCECNAGFIGDGSTFENINEMWQKKDCFVINGILTLLL